MSNLSQAQREKEPADIFCGPGRSYPVKDCSDVGDAAGLAGKAANPDAVRSCIARRAKTLGCSLPKSWQHKEAKMSATVAGVRAITSGTYLMDQALFASEPPPGYTRRRGKIFELGEYPDNPAPGMTFSLDEDEADRAIAAFTPVQGDLEHKGTVLDGKLGIMRKVWREGKRIMGEVDVPDWLHEQLPVERSSVSTAWDFKDKLLKGWGWVKDPAIPDAALFSAYATFAAKQRQLEAEDTQAESNQVRLTPRQQKEIRFMPLAQQIQSKLSAMFSKPQTVPGTLDASGLPGAKPDLGLIEGLPAAVAAKAQADAAAGAAAGGETGQGDEQKPPAASFSAPGSPNDPEPIDEGMAEFRAQQIVTRATETADRLIAEGHVLSFGRNALIAVFTAAGYDNEQSGPSVVTFSKSNGTVLTDRVQMLAEAFQATPKHSLFSDSMPVHVLNGDRGEDAQADKDNEAARQAAAFNEQFAGLFGGKLPAGTDGPKG